MENFDLKKFLVENKLTTNSRLLKEVEKENIDLEQAFHDAKINWSEEVVVVYESANAMGEPEIFYIRPDDILADLQNSIEESGDAIVSSNTDKSDSIGRGEDQTEGLTFKLVVEILDDGLYEIWQDDYPTDAKAHPDFFSNDIRVNPSLNENSGEASLSDLKKHFDDEDIDCSIKDVEIKKTQTKALVVDPDDFGDSPAKVVRVVNRVFNDYPNKDNFTRLKTDPKGYGRLIYIAK
jgi:hypothetical protein